MSNRLVHAIIKSLHAPDTNRAKTVVEKWTSDIGDRYDNWTVIANVRDGRRLCRCKCGAEKEVSDFRLRFAKKLICHGCAGRDYFPMSRLGLDKTELEICRKLRSVHHGMLQRCENQKREQYPRYGGRGIRVCHRWHSFKNFITDMRPTFKMGLTIERIDVNGNYEPENCTWIPPKDQYKNRRAWKDWTRRA